MGLTAEERDELRSNADRTTASGGRIALVLLLFFGGLAALFAARGGLSELSAPWNVIVTLLPFVVFTALLTPVLIQARRRADVALVEGADSRTRRAVEGAIRAGSSDDPRIDDLVEDMRAHRAGRRFATTAVAQAFAGIALLAAAIISDELVARVLLAGAAVGTLTAAGLLLLRRRRLLAYRVGGRTPAREMPEPPPGPPAAVKGD
jgi:hypothetical protein